MKKMLIVIAAITILVGYSVVAKAESVSTTVPLSLSIPAAFGFTLDKYSADFGTVNLGSVGGTNIGIFCRSNHCVKWYMALKADAFTSGANTIPSDPNFTFAAWSNIDPEQAKGIFTPPMGGTAIPVPATQTDFYASTPAEGNDPFVPMTLGVGVKVPATQASGLYSTNLVLTMHE